MTSIRADVYKIHVKTKKNLKNNRSDLHANLGAAPWSKDFRTPEKDKTSLDTASTISGRVRRRAAKWSSRPIAMLMCPAWLSRSSTMQLFTMDDDGANAEPNQAISTSPARCIR